MLNIPRMLRSRREKGDLTVGRRGLPYASSSFLLTLPEKRKKNKKGMDYPHSSSQLRGEGPGGLSPFSRLGRKDKVHGDRPTCACKIYVLSPERKKEGKNAPRLRTTAGITFDPAFIFGLEGKKERRGDRRHLGFQTEQGIDCPAAEEKKLRFCARRENLQHDRRQKEKG